MSAPIGIFDSGLGGLSILQHVRTTFQEADFIFLADNANFPFGEKTNEEVVELTGRGIRALADLGCETIVLACNTAATTSLEQYQKMYSDLVIDGVTPLLGQAVAQSASKTVAVYATHATLESEHFKHVLAATPPGVRVLAEASYDWVRSVEAGEFAPASVATTVGRDLAKGADVVVLGCTHFAYLEPEVRRVAGPDVAILQPGPDIAARLKSQLGEQTGAGTVRYFLTAPSDRFDRLASQLTGTPVTSSQLPK